MSAGAPIRDIESMTGVLINTVPRRVVLNPENTVLETLQRIQAEQLEISKHESVALPALQSAGILVSDMLGTILNFWGHGSVNAMKDEKDLAEDRLFAQSHSQPFGR